MYNSFQHCNRFYPVLLCLPFCDLCYPLNPVYHVNENAFILSYTNQSYKADDFRIWTVLPLIIIQTSTENEYMLLANTSTNTNNLGILL